MYNVAEVKYTFRVAAMLFCYHLQNIRGQQRVVYFCNMRAYSCHIKFQKCILGVLMALPNYKFLSFIQEIEKY